MLGPDPNQVTSVLLFAASTSRQLRAVSEGPQRKGKGARDYYTWLEAKYSKAFYVGESRASGGPVVAGTAIPGPYRSSSAV